MLIELAHATAMTGRFAATTIRLVTETALTCKIRRLYRFDMYAEHIVLSSHSTCRIRFHLCKETKGGRLRHKHTSGLLKEVTSRLNNLFAEKFNIIIFIFSFCSFE